MAESVDDTDILRALLARASQGDKEALGELLQLHRGYLRVLAQRELGTRLEVRMDASDLVQQTCLSAYRSFSDFQGTDIAAFVAWLRRIHERNLRDTIREHVLAAKRSVDNEQPLDVLREKEMAARQDPSPTARALANEEAVVLALAMEQLPADQREAIRLRHLEDTPLAEIANYLGRSEDAIGGLLKRGMRTLRQRLKMSSE